MTDTPAPARPAHRSRWLRRLGFSALFVLVLGGAVYLLLPPVATWQIETQLEKLGAKSVQVGSLRINPATGEIELENFKSVGPDGEDILIGKAKLRINLPVLVRRQITISELSVSDADIDIRRDAKGLWSIGGFPMAFASTDKPADPGAPWQLDAANIAVDNSQITLNLGPSLQKALVEKLRVDRLSTAAPADPAAISVSVVTSGGKIAVDGKAFPFAVQPSAAFSINTAALKLEAFKDFIAAGRIKDIAGTAAIAGMAKAGFRKDGGTAVSFDGKATLSRTRVQTTLFGTDAQKLSWQGSARMSLPGTDAAPDALPALDVKGKVSAAGFAFLNRISKVSLSAAAASFDLSGSGVTIKPAPGNTGTTVIRGEIAAKLGNARFDQPETQLTLAPEEIDVTGRATLTLPPRTAAFSAKFSGTVTANALRGSLKPAGIDRLDAATYRIAYKDALLNVTAAGEMSGNVAGDLALTGVVLEAPQLGGSFTAGAVRSTAERISFGQTETGALKLSLTGGLTASDISTQSTDKSWSANQKTAEWTGRIAIDPAGGTTPADGLSMSGDVKLTGFDATLAADDPFRVTLESARAQGISVTPTGHSVKRVSIAGLSAAGAADKSSLPRLRLKTLLATDITRDPDGKLVLNSLRASGLSGEIVRSAKGAIVLPALPASASKTTSASGASPTHPEQPAMIRIGNAVLTDSSVAFVDHAVAPSFAIETSQFEASLSDFDTAKPQSDARLNVLLGLGKFGRIQIDGSVKPDLENTTADLGIGFRNIELFKFNGYIVPAIKHSIRQGRTDGEIALKLTESKLDAATSLTIRRLKVTPAPRPKGAKTTDSGPPIETALGLIQDDKGIVKLSIPITGSLEDPKFDLSDAIGQAVGGAMQKTLMTAVKIAFPLGAVVAIVDAVGTPQITVKPLLFVPGSAALSPALKGRIAEIAGYLKKQPKEAPSMCGPATASDVLALRKIAPKAGQKAAIDLAAARISAVRDELVSIHSIPAGRIFICAPEFVGAAETLPSVTVDLKR